MPEQSRRKFLSKLALAFGSLSGLGEPAISLWARAWGAVKKRVLGSGTDRNSLINENPKELDARNMAPTALNDFGIMGLSDHDVDLGRWSLEVEGWVDNPFRISYQQIRDLPAIERKVLLICPGYFANQGLWKGISIKTLLKKARAKPGVKFVTISGPDGDYNKPERFPLEEIQSNKVFLAYQVNGADLPRKNGFPLRLVAEDYYGSVWVKYVDKITMDKG
jgi:sulfoxide reductase catalytic subunit YedY